MTGGFAPFDLHAEHSPSCVPTGSGPSLVSPPPLAFLVAQSTLGFEARLFGGTRRLRRPPLLRNDERPAHELREPKLGALAILSLTATIARHDANAALAIQTRGQLPEHSLSLRVIERARRADVPHQLDPRGRRVDVLAAGPTGSRRTSHDLIARDDDQVVDADAVRALVGHALLRARPGRRTRGRRIGRVAMDAKPGDAAAIERNDLELTAREGHPIADLRQPPESAERVAA